MRWITLQPRFTVEGPFSEIAVIISRCFLRGDEKKLNKLGLRGRFQAAAQNAVSPRSRGRKVCVGRRPSRPRLRLPLEGAAAFR